MRYSCLTLKQSVWRQLLCGLHANGMLWRFRLLPADILLVRRLGDSGANHHLALALGAPEHEQLAADLCHENTGHLWQKRRISDDSGFSGSCAATFFELPTIL